MPKRHTNHTAFTLLEVMVAVMIVSVVIAALLQMQGSTSNKLFQIKKMMSSAQYSSFLVSNRENYGFEASSTDMTSLLEDFELESDLRRSLKAFKVKVDYEKLSTIDTSEISETVDEDTQESASAGGVVFEIGKSVLKTQDFTNELIRVRLQ